MAPTAKSNVSRRRKAPKWRSSWGPGPTINLQRAENLPEKMSQLVTREFYDYFAVKYLRAKHNVCAIPHWLYWEIHHNKEQELRVPEKDLNRCLRSKSRFVSVPMCLQSVEGGAHANALFIDTKAMTAERFEPHGARAYKLFPDYEYKALDDAMATYLSGKTLQYIAASEFSPFRGPQAMERYMDESGYCAAWSLWYTDMRLSYPEVPRDTLALAIFNKLQKKRTDGTLSNYLLDYVKQVYRLMIHEFPQYRDFFLHYDAYRRIRRNHVKYRAFQRFREHMSDLANNQPMKKIKHTSHRHGARKPSYKRPAKIQAGDLTQTADVSVAKLKLRQYKKR